MTDSNKCGNIEKLNHGNYSTWKYEMRMLLCREDLWEYVSEPMPEQTARTAVWRKGDAKALGTIALGCEKSQFNIIRSCNHAKDAWGKLAEAHAHKTVVSRIALLKNLCSKKLKEGGNIEQHLMEMDELFSKLDDCDMTFPEMYRVVIVLASLPDTYDTLVVSLESKDDNQLSIPFVKQKLVDEYNRQKQKIQGIEDEQLMLARNNQIRRNHDIRRNNGFRPNFERHNDAPEAKPGCWKCGDLTHIRRYCPKLTPQERANIAKWTVDEDDSICFTVIDEMICNGWYLDSGATKHMCRDRNLFETIKLSNGANVIMANGAKVAEKGRGVVKIKCIDDVSRSREVTIEDVLWLPELEANLISISKLAQKGLVVTFASGGANISKNGKIVATAKLINGLYKMQQVDQVMVAHDNTHKENCIHQWHRRLGHRDFEALKKLKRDNLVTGIVMTDCGIEERCECCLQGKMARAPFPLVPIKKTKQPLDLVHTDICGPVAQASKGGKRYVLTLIDDYSDYSETHFLQEKSEAATIIKQFVARMVTEFGRKPKVIRSDRGGEYTSKALLWFYKEEGIVPQFTVPYSPQQNGKAERKNRYLVEMTRCLLLDSGLDKSFWAEAMKTANYIQNRVPTSTHGRTPYELWFGERPDLSNMHVFGSRAWVQIPKVKRTKLESTSTCMRFIGYASQQKGYRFWDPVQKQCVISRDVKFVELNNGSYQHEKDTMVHASNQDHSSVEEVPASVFVQENEEAGIIQESESTEPQALRRSTRKKGGVIDPFIKQNYYLYLADEKSQEPCSYGEAIASNEADKWKEAMNAEYDSLKNNNTWDLVELPQNRTAIGCKWVFKRKADEDGRSTSYKARLVAQGFAQRYKMDYDEVFAPVVKASTVRLLLAIASVARFQVRQIDVKSAFLNGDLEEEIYMKQPEGYTDRKDSEKVCRLKKSLYGLKQAARSWNQKLTAILSQIGFKQSDEDECLFVMEGRSSIIYLCCHVDDMMIVGKDERELVSIEEELATHFKVTTLGDMRHFLGLKVERDENGIFHISQIAFIEKLLVQFAMTEAKPSKIPIDTGYNSTDDESKSFEPTHLYRSLIGGLLYLSTNTRPDIAAATSILSRKLECPTYRDWQEAKRILRYLKGTKCLRLRLGTVNSNMESDLIGYVDADHAGDQTDRKSNSGYVFLYRGAPISWTCRKQTSVAISSTEAEYIALSEACQELVSLVRVFEDLSIHTTLPIRIMEDNQSCIQLATSKRIGRRSKHIETRYHYVRELTEKNTINLQYCSSENMLADLFTKPLGATKTQKFREMIGLFQNGNAEEEC